MGVHFELLHVCDFGCVVHLEKLPSLMIPRKFTKIKKKTDWHCSKGLLKKKRGRPVIFKTSVRLVIYKLFQPSSGTCMSCHPSTRGSKRWGCLIGSKSKVSRLHPHGQEFIENDIFFLNILWYLVLFVMMNWVSGVVFAKPGKRLFCLKI